MRPPIRAFQMRLLTCLVTVVSACETGQPESVGAPSPAASSTPSPPPTAGPAWVAAVRELVGRPVQVPLLTPGESCPVTRKQRPVQTPPIHAAADVLGDAPVYPVPMYFGEDTTLRLDGPETDGWYSAKAPWEGHHYQGPAVIHVRRLDAPGTGRVLPLHESEGKFVGDAVVLRISAPPAEFPTVTKVAALTRVPAPGCYAYQVDGLGFSEVIVFRGAAPGQQ
ncbi:MAG: hypothetical protein ACRDT4_12250 [Micromonosporaceae bacterium]